MRMSFEDAVRAAISDHPTVPAVIIGTFAGLLFAFDRARRLGRSLNWRLIRELSASSAFALVLTSALVEVWELRPMTASAVCMFINMIGVVGIDRWSSAAESRVLDAIRGEKPDVDL